MIILGFRNESSLPRVIYIEPAGGDYTLMPNEDLEIHVKDEPPTTFNLIEGERFTQVFLNNVTIKNLATVYSVRQNGQEIKAGHNHEHDPHP